MRWERGDTGEEDRRSADQEVGDSQMLSGRQEVMLTDVKETQVIVLINQSAGKRTKTGNDRNRKQQVKLVKNNKTKHCQDFTKTSEQFNPHIILSPDKYF